MPAARKPTALRVLSDTGRDRIGHRSVRSEPKPRLGAEAPPKAIDKRARAEYERIVEEMRHAHPALLTKLDTQELAVFCEAWVLWLDMSEKLDRERAAGRAIDRFDVVMWTKFAQQLHMSGDRLGMSPVARAHLTMPEASSEDGDDF